MSKVYAILDARLRVVRMFASETDAEAHARFLRSLDRRRSYVVQPYRVEYGQA